MRNKSKPTLRKQAEAMKECKGRLQRSRKAPRCIRRKAETFQGMGWAECPKGRGKSSSARVRAWHLKHKEYRPHVLC